MKIEKDTQKKIYKKVANYQYLKKKSRNKI